MPTKRRRRWLLWVVIAAILAVGGCGALVATVGVRAFHDFDGARSTTNEFLSAIERGDGGRAQALLCDEAAPDAVQRLLTAGITGHRVTGLSVHSGFGSPHYGRKRADVTVDLTLDGGVHHRDVVAMAYEHDAWRVCNVFRTGPG